MDRNELEKMIAEAIGGVKPPEHRQPQSQSKEQPAMFARYAQVLQGVTTPEIEYILQSENAQKAEAEMLQKFNEFLFANFKYDFAKACPEVCDNYVNIVIANKEEYAKMNLNKVKEQAEALEKANSEKADLQKQLAELKARLNVKSKSEGTLV